MALHFRMSPDQRFDPEIILTIASMDYQAGRFADALRGYSTVLRMRPGDARVLYQIGLAEIELRQIDSGLGHIKQAITLEPRRVEFLIGLARTYGRLTKFEEALKTSGRAVREAPESTEAFAGVIQCTLELMRRGQQVAPVPIPSTERRADKTISVIACSRDEDQGRRIRAHYEALLEGYSFEIIQIYDARSLCDGYNRGFARSGGDAVIFSHDDIEIASPEFAGRLLRHLETNDIVGIAGTSRLVGASWAAAGWPCTHGCIAHHHLDGQGFDFECYGPSASGTIEAVDGVFMAANRRVCEAVKFDDATFDGFHFYDLDFTYRAFREGFLIAVPWDLLVVHQVRPDHPVNWGKYPKEWENQVPTFLNKHGLKAAPDRPSKRWPAVRFEKRDEMIAFHQAMTFALEAD